MTSAGATTPALQSPLLAVQQFRYARPDAMKLYQTTITHSRTVFFKQGLKT